MVATPVILDIGEFSSKIGFGSENDPRHTFYTIVGQPKYTTVEMGFNNKTYYVGNEVSNSMGLYKINYPIKEGKIDDWKLFEYILDYVFYQLKVDPTVVNVLYSYHPLITEEEQNELLRIFFNKYQVAGFYPVLDALLTMYSGGFQTGIVVEMGASANRIVPIYEGYILDHAVQLLRTGGTVIDNFMHNEVKNAGFCAETSVQKQIVRVLKEKACFCSLDYDEDLKNKKHFRKEFQMPDGCMVELDEARFKVPELLFHPELFNLEEKGLHEAILDCVELCDIDIRTDLLNNIFLSGGSSLFPQLEYRLEHELEIGLIERGKKERTPRIIAPKERIFSTWIGGSILSYIPEFQDSWISRGQYYRDEVPDDIFS